MQKINQFGIGGMVGEDPSVAKPSYQTFMIDYGFAVKTFNRGVLDVF
jgi:hypothetical protein